MRTTRSIALVTSVVGTLLLVGTHQALTKDAKKTLAVISTSDVIGYTSPCG
jgi:hypothetical protein